MPINNEVQSRLLYALKNANKKSKYWNNIFKKNQVNFEKKNFKFDQIPLLTKKDLLIDQQKNSFLGKILSIKINEVSRTHKTSGTSSSPLYIYLSKKDIDDTIRVSKNCYLAAGVNKSDKIIHCLNFNMWSGGITDYQALEATSAMCVPYGIGNTELLIKTIQDLKINAISCTPSYMQAIEQKCDELGVNPKKLGLRKGLFGGESLIQHKNLKKKIESTFEMKAIDANYGLSEILSIIGGEDIAKKNCLKFHGLDMLYIELIDKKNKSIEIKNGTTGELVLSTLKKEGQPLFRYRTNDIIKIASVKKDKDKKITELFFNVMGRSDQMLIIKGVNFFPESINEMIINEFPKLNLDFKILKPKSFDNISSIDILLDVKNKVDTNYKKVIKKILEEKIRAIFTIKAIVNFSNFKENLSNKKNIFN
jgi:phenylacetate-CoA ligase